MKVEPGAYCPVDGEVRARCPDAVRAREDGTVRGPDRDQRRGRRGVAERGEGGLGLVLQGRVEGGHQVAPVGRRDLEERAQPVVGVTRDDRGAGDAPQLLVVAGLEAGEADLVAGDDAAARLLDDLGRGRSDAPEQGRGELAARRQRERVAHRQGARHLPEGRQHVERVVLAQHDRLHEGLGAHRLRALDVRLHVDVEDPGDPAGAARHLRTLDLGLVQAVAQHRSLGHQHGAVVAGDVAADRNQRADAERLALGEVGCERLRRPVDLPLLAGRREPDGGLVLPRVGVGHLPAPGQGGRRALPSASSACSTSTTSTATGTSSSGVTSSVKAARAVSSASGTSPSVCSDSAAARSSARSRRRVGVVVAAEHRAGGPDPHEQRRPSPH